MKLAILSGTFNPIHKLHIAIAKYVKENFAYDKLLLIPAFIPPFKEKNSELAHHRFNMVKDVCDKYEEFEISDIEFKRNELSYSCTTLEELHKKFKPENIGFIIGTDAYINLDKWHNADKLKSLATFILFEREIPFEDEKVKRIEDKGFINQKAYLPFTDVSSSHIRELIKNDKDVTEFLEKETEEYIKKHGLYK